MKAMVRFFETGDPNWEGIPEWKPLGDEREKMVWDGRIHTEPLTEEETLNRFPDEVFRLKRSPDHAVSTKETADPPAHRQCRMQQWRKHRISSPG